MLLDTNHFLSGGSPSLLEAPEGSAGTGRPIRAAVATAAAISEAQNDILAKFDRSVTSYILQCACVITIL